MATTFVDYTGDGNATKSFSFPSYKVEDIKVEVDNVVKTVSTHYNITSYTTTGGGNVVFTSGNIPQNTTPATQIRIFRDTDVDSAKATYTAGSSVKAADLNNNHTQLLYAAQEEQNQTILTSNIKDAAITTAKITDTNVTTAKIADDAVTADKLANTAVTAGSYTATDLTVDAQGRITSASNGTIGTSEIAADAITGAKIADDAVDSEHLAADSIDAEHYAAGSVDTTALGADAVTGAKIADDAVDTEHLADNAVGILALAPGAVTTAKLVDSSVTTAKIADANITTAKITDANVTTAKIAGANVTDAKLASNSVTTSKITDANVTTIKVADANITLAKLASDLKQTTISDSDTQLPTSGAVVDYVAAQLLPFGGFEAIATEVAFPNTQPASGVIISISDAQGVVVNGSGTSTTGRTVGGSTVTINNFPSSLNSETLAAGVGLMVSSTGSSQTYNYHKILAAETDVKQLSDDINDFISRYRVGSSNPTSSLNGGDLFFNTGSGKLLVYNATSSAWEETQSVGNFFINTISSYTGTGGNSASFNGSAYRFVLSNPGANAEQHLVSINGVIQKPNSGTSQPSEGFAIDGSSIIFSAAPASGADFFIITIGASVSIGTPSDGTVSTAKLTSGAVTTAKIADDAVTADKIANSVNSAIAANTAKTTNATHTGDVTGSTSLTIASGAVTTAKIADDAVTAAKLANTSVTAASYGSSTSIPSITVDAQGRITAASGNSVNTDLVGDTSPQLGGHLSANTFNIEMGDSAGTSSGRLNIGASQDLAIYHDGSHSRINGSGTGKLILMGSEINLNNSDSSEYCLRTLENGAVELYHDNSKKLETTSGGANVIGRLTTDSLSITDDGSSSPLVHLSQDDSSPWAFVLSNQTYHDSSDSGLKHYVANDGNAVTQIRGNSAFKSYTLSSTDGSTGNDLLQLTSDRRVKLYYQGAAKCQTGATGLEIMQHTDLRFPTSGNWTGEGTCKIQHHSNKLYVQVPANGIQVRDLAGNTVLEMGITGGITSYTDLTFDPDVYFNGGAGAIQIKAGSDIRFTSGNWTGETAAKIQYHSNSLYYQSTGNHNFRNASGTNTFTIDSSGNFSSDERKKENITTVTDALTKVSQLRGVEFKWKEKYGSKEDMGLIAQEVEAVLPRLITNSQDPEGYKENEDGTPMKMMNYNGLFSVMIEAIKELKAKVETLEAA